MKKILSLILALMLVLSLVACTERETEDATTPEGTEAVENGSEAPTEDNKTPSEENNKEETKEEIKEETTTAPVTDKTVGQTLLSTFKANASDSATAYSIAETLVSNEAIPFNGGTISVEEGLLTGFGNTEIKGFSEGAMFAPMIGTIPFVGYVFTLPEGANAASFIASLESAANLNWNVCTTADEMVTGSSGNKVFFVMCPKKFDVAE